MEKLIGEPLFYIFFIYGFSFLLMAYLIIKGARAATSAPLIIAFYMLALFGITHGVTEIVDWIRFIVKTLGVAEIRTLTYISQIFLVVSFVFLLQFGVNLLTYRSENKSAYRAIPLILLVVYGAVILALGITDIIKIGLIGRYSFGFVGALLSAVSLFVVGSAMKPLGNQKLDRGLTIAAAGFICYAVFGGLIIRPIAGIPIQLFRSACAVTIAFASFSVIDIYQYVESKKETAIR
jgi:hypothetical protein